MSKQLVRDSEVCYAIVWPLGRETPKFSGNIVSYDIQ